MTKHSAILIIISIISLQPNIASDKQKIYSLVTDLEPLLKTQSKVIFDLEKIIGERKMLLSFFKSELECFKTEHRKIKANGTRYFNDNFNIFTFIKRFSSDVIFLRNLVKEPAKLRRSKVLKYPTERDFDEAARMVLRLQRVYLLNVTQLANGILDTTFSSSGKPYTEMFLPMTSSDCFELSKIIYHNKFYKSGLPWLFEALRLYAEENHTLGVTDVDIVEAISNGYNFLKNKEKYIEWTTKLLDMKPNFDEEKIKDFEVMIGIYKLRLMRRQQKQWENEVKNEKKFDKEAAKREAFKILCRGKETIGKEVSKRLKCWYFTGYHPLTKLARFRAELLYLRPEVLLIHDAITDSEAEKIKTIAVPQLGILPTQRSAKSTTMYVRLSKGMEFNNKTLASSIRPVIRRVSDMTGHSAGPNPLSVNNYGVGGHYILHRDGQDWVDEDTLLRRANSVKLKGTQVYEFIKSMKWHIRIVTVLFYLSDVEQGGATVFPWLGLSVFPVKGAALVWTNLLPSGRADALMEHGACPVLRGSKWVATKWINGYNQELRRPCSRADESNISRRPKDIAHVFKSSIYTLVKDLKGHMAKIVS